MKPPTEVLHAADALTTWFRDVSTEIDSLARDVASLLESNLGGRNKVDKAARVGLEGLSREFLTRNAFAVGAGTFFAAESVIGNGRASEWWSRKEPGTIQRLDFDLTPGSNRYYDYEKLPFFSIPADTGERTIWGPYIDYLGFEEYILTVTAPFSVQGNFMGVAGCDIRLTDLEPIIMPNLRSIPNDAALVNASNRVILGNSGMYLVGERVKHESSGHERVALDVPHLGLALIYGSQP